MEQRISETEIQSRAAAFVQKWANETSEDAEAKSFLDDFFNVYGVTRRRFASYEERVKRTDGSTGYIDLLWRGVLLVEMKSRGKDLSAAYAQAETYIAGLKAEDRPRFVMVSDFATIRLTNRDTNATTTFKLKDFPRFTGAFNFIAGEEAREVKEQAPVNAQAAQALAALHDALADIGYTGEPLQKLMVRLLFCLFAEDAGIFVPQGMFETWLRKHTKADGSDLARCLNELFDVLDTAPAKRLKNLDDSLRRFPFVNGKLFRGGLKTASFDAKMREALLGCCEVDWSRVSPIIFGTLFQGVMDKKQRRTLGAHYTSEENIHKVIDGLFLDDLKAELEGCGHDARRLTAFHHKLRRLRFFDPACGAGNFLVETYREIRELELEVLTRLNPHGQMTTDIETLVKVNVDQFFGIEIDAFAAEVAQVALWMMDHLMNRKVGEAFGKYFARVPLIHSPTILCANSLRTDWKEFLPPSDDVYVLGNPPFVGARTKNAEQKADVALVMKHIHGHGDLDFVCCWFVKAAEYMKGTRMRAAFVSTSSICQGEQPGILFGPLLREGIRLHFAWRPFKWTNGAKGQAAVHCVVVGFGYARDVPKTLDGKDVRNINPFLYNSVDAPLLNRATPIEIGTTGIITGSMPLDDGNYLFTAEEKTAFVYACPESKPFFRRWSGANEAIHDIERWCLYLGDRDSTAWRDLTPIRDRVDAVAAFRKASTRPATQRLAAMPARFAEDRVQKGAYLTIPKTSSEARAWLPICFQPATTITGDGAHVVPNATIHDFAVLTSSMHMAWVRAVSGRFGSGFRYSVGIVYNNFPWPEKLVKPSSQSDYKLKADIGVAAQRVLDVRASYPGQSLAQLYDRVAMPVDLLKAHQELDRLVDRAYGKSFKSDEERINFLFDRWLQLTAAEEEASAA